MNHISLEARIVKNHIYYHIQRMFILVNNANREKGNIPTPIPRIHFDKSTSVSLIYKLLKKQVSI